MLAANFSDLGYNTD